MKRKLVLLSIISYISIFLFNIYAYEFPHDAEITLGYSNKNLQKSSVFSIDYKISSPNNMSLASMSMEIKFDSNKLIFQKKLCHTKNAGDCLEKICDGDTVKLIYMNCDGIPINSNELKDILDISFKVKGDVPYGATDIITKIENVYDDNYNEIKTNSEIKTSLNIAPPDISKCMLKSITPSEGVLSPQFKPNVYNYTIDVNNDVKELNFDCVPMGPNCVTRVNRHKLDAAGKMTNFKITVCNTKERNAELIYAISVNRAPNPHKESKNNKNIKKNKSSRLKSSKFTADDAELSSIDTEYGKQNSQIGDSSYSEENSVEEDLGIRETFDEDEKYSNLENNSEYEELNACENGNLAGFSEENTSSDSGAVWLNDDEKFAKHSVALIVTLIIAVFAFIYSLVKITNFQRNISGKFTFPKENIINL